MQTLTTAAELRRALTNARKSDKRVGFVPTMGYLHDGHLALVEASRAQCDVTVVSIFVNPAQFGPNEDLSTYPRDFPRDEKLCRDAKVALLFAPDARKIYPPTLGPSSNRARLQNHCAELSGLGIFAASPRSSANYSTWCSPMSLSLDKRIFNNVRSCATWQGI